MGLSSCFINLHRNINRASETGSERQDVNVNKCWVFFSQREISGLYFTGLVTNLINLKQELV